MTRIILNYYLLIFVLPILWIIACSNPIQHPASGSVKQLSAEAQDCIKRVIAEDESLGAIRNHACETISLAETIRNYADGLKQIDYAHCPDKFAEAFAKHQDAWRRMIPHVEKYPDLRGEMHDLFEIMEKEKDADSFNPLLKDIWDTWSEIEKTM